MRTRRASWLSIPLTVTLLGTPSEASSAAEDLEPSLGDARITRSQPVDDPVDSPEPSPPVPFMRGAAIPETVEIAPSTFTMGDGVAICGSGIREVTLTRSYAIGLLEITNVQYVERLQWAYDQGYVGVVDGRAVDLIGDGAYLVDLASPLTEIRFDPGTERFAVEESQHALNNAFPGGYDPSNHPAKRVSWNGAAAFCDWINLEQGLPLAYDHVTWECNGGDPYGAIGYRLPTDAEWECAASSGDDRSHPWGDEPPTCLLANCSVQSSECGRWTAPVGTRPDGANGHGMLDVGGNAGEWCNDFHECELPSGTFVDPVGPETGAKKVLRGGGFFYTGVYTRCANRDADPPGFPYQATGFRIARTSAATSGAPEQTDGGGTPGAPPTHGHDPADGVLDSDGRGASPGEGDGVGVGIGVSPGEALPFGMGNPARGGTLHLSAQSAAEGTLTLVDAAGRRVREYVIHLQSGTRSTLSTHGIRSGAYYVEWRPARGSDGERAFRARGRIVIVD